jgi:putative colanic acid biosynthesis acetyltransferase WcaB
LKSAIPTHPIFCDWQVNRGNTKGRVIMLLFRAAAKARALPAPFWYCFLPYLAFYKFFVDWLLGVEIRAQTRIGPRLQLWHPRAIVIHERAVLGADCTVRQSTTIGNKTGPDGAAGAAPVIGDRVDIGSNAVIIGPITIGDGAKIGAGSVVVKDVLPGATAVGNPARIIQAPY